MPFYDLKITPQKEKNTAHIHLLLKDSEWNNYSELQQKITDSIPGQYLLKKEIPDQTTLFLEVAYGQLEEIANSLENLLSSDGKFKLSKKQIYILKLGGWFDY